MSAIAFPVMRTRGHLLFERNLMVYRRTWLTLISGFFEPMFYLFSIGIGLGHFVGTIHGVSNSEWGPVSRCVTWPSTQTLPSRWTQSARTAQASFRTGRRPTR